MIGLRLALNVPCVFLKGGCTELERQTGKFCRVNLGRAWLNPINYRRNPAFKKFPLPWHGTGFVSVCPGEDA